MQTTVVPRRDRSVDELKEIIGCLVVTLESLRHKPRRCAACDWVDVWNNIDNDAWTVWRECEDCDRVLCHFCLRLVGIEKNDKHKKVVCCNCVPEAVGRVLDEPSQTQTGSKKRKFQQKRLVLHPGPKPNAGELAIVICSVSDNKKDEPQKVLKIVQGPGLAFAVGYLGHSTGNAELSLGHAGTLLQQKINDLDLSLDVYVFKFDKQHWLWATPNLLLWTSNLCGHSPGTSFTVFRNTDPALDPLRRLEAALKMESRVGVWTWIGSLNYPKALLFNPQLELPDHDQWSESDPETEQL